MGALSSNDPARTGGSSSGYDSNKTILPGYLPRPRARASPTSYCSDGNRTIHSGEWPGRIPHGRDIRSRSAPRSYTPTVYAGCHRYTPSPEAVLGIPPRPMARPSPTSARGASPIYRSPPRLAPAPSPPAAERRIHDLEFMGWGPRRVATGTSSRALPPARPRLVGSGDSIRIRTEPRSLSPRFADECIAQARRENSGSTRSTMSEESRAARRARVVQLAQSAASYEFEVAQGLPALARRGPQRYLTPSRIHWRDDNPAPSRFYSVAKQERRNLDDSAGLLSDGESRVPFRYPRQEPYQVYRYGERAFSPRRPRSAFHWEFFNNRINLFDTVQPLQ